jgi:hypothetical protein
MLTIPEELWLLAFNEKKGDARKAYLTPALAGGLLIQLALEKRVEVEGKNRLVVKDATPTGEPLIDHTVERIARITPPLAVHRWLFDLQSLDQKPIRQRVAEALIERGHLHIREYKLLGLFNARKYVLSDASIRQDLMQNLRGVAFEEKKPTLHLVCWMILAGQCDLVRITKNSEERKDYQARIKRLATMFEEPRAAHARAVILAVLKGIESYKESAPA